MSTRFVKVLVAVAVMATAGVMVASAAPVGRAAPITPQLAAYFSGYGVDPQYLGQTPDKIPADQEAKIVAVLSMQDDQTTGLYPHGELTSLVWQALSAASFRPDDPVYVTIGGNVWQMELGTNPASVPASKLTAADNLWVPLS